MPTEKPRVTITMTDDQLKEIEAYRYGRKMKNQTQAILSLIERGFDALAADNTSSSKKTAPLYSSEAAKIAKDYDSLDHWGKAAVRSVADTELARMQDEARFLAETSMEPEPKVVNLFTDPSAAGPALGITGQSCEPYTLTPNDKKVLELRKDERFIRCSYSEIVRKLLEAGLAAKEVRA